MSEEIKSPDDLLTPKQVAEIWQVTVRTVRNWSNLGRLNPLRMGNGTVRFLRSDVIQAREKYEFGDPEPPHDPSLG